MICVVERQEKGSLPGVSTVLLHPKVKLWQHPTLIHVASKKSSSSPEPILVFPAMEIESGSIDYNIHSNPAFDAVFYDAAILPENEPLRQAVLQLDELMRTLTVRHLQPDKSIIGTESLPGPASEIDMTPCPVPHTRDEMNTTEPEAAEANPPATVAFLTTEVATDSTVSTPCDVQPALPSPGHFHLSHIQRLDFELLVDAVMMMLPPTKVTIAAGTWNVKLHGRSMANATLLAIFEHVANIAHVRLCSNGELITCVPNWTEDVKHVLRALLLDIGNRVSNILAGSCGSIYSNQDTELLNGYNSPRTGSVQIGGECQNLLATVLGVLQAQHDMKMDSDGSGVQPFANESREDAKHCQLKQVLSNLNPGKQGCKAKVQQVLRQAAIDTHQTVLCTLLSPQHAYDLVSYDGQVDAGEGLTTVRSPIEETTLDVETSRDLRRPSSMQTTMEAPDAAASAG